MKKRLLAFIATALILLTMGLGAFAETVNEDYVLGHSSTAIFDSSVDDMSTYRLDAGMYYIEITSLNTNVRRVYISNGDQNYTFDVGTLSASTVYGVYIILPEQSSSWRWRITKNANIDTIKVYEATMNNVTSFVFRHDDAPAYTLTSETTGITPGYYYVSFSEALKSVDLFSSTGSPYGGIDISYALYTGDNGYYIYLDDISYVKTTYSAALSDGLTINLYNAYPVISSADYDAGYENGYNNGYEAGEGQGYKDGYEAGETAGEATGYQNGYTAGETAGYQNGYTAGETAGQEAGYNTGYEAGYNKGLEAGSGDYNAGFQAGYNAGKIDGQDFNDAFNTFFYSFFDGLSGFFSPLLSLGVGNLTIGSIVGLIGVVILVVFMIKLVKG